MKYIYIPNSISKNKINEKFKNEDEYIEYQFKYRNLLETIILQYIDEKIIIDIMSNIPKCDDTYYNFYHKKTLFKNGYLFLRNNIHVENLNAEELQQLSTLEISFNNEIVDFINKTLLRVIYESDGASCYGVLIDKNIVGPNRLVFELAYDFKKCNIIEQHQAFESFDKIYNYLTQSLEKCKIKFALVRYDMMPNLYFSEDNEVCIMSLIDQYIK